MSQAIHQSYHIQFRYQNWYWVGNKWYGNIQYLRGGNSVSTGCRNHPQKHHGGTDAQIGLQAHTNEKFYYFKEMQIILRRAGITNPVSQGRHDTHN